ncbi:MAG: outer membrane protein assembly factor BamD [Thermoanaerobaculia bacterium]
MRSKLAIVFVLLAVFLTACGHRNQFKPVVNPEFLNKSKEELFKKAESLFDEHKWSKAREYYSYVYENFPNDPIGRRSLLRVADTYYQQGDTVNLVEAQYKYRDFINRYPGSEMADYAMLQIANVSYKQMLSPERDQTKTKEAVQKFKEMLDAYPHSAYRAEAEEKLHNALGRLAQHDHEVAEFYMKRGRYKAAMTRLNQVIDSYPDYEHRDQVFFDLATSLSHLGRKGEARLYYERIVSEFPKSDLANRAKEKLQDTKA